MGQLLATMTLHQRDGVPADDVQNSFAFTTATVPPSAAEIDDITAALDNFLNANQSLGVAVGHYLAESVDSAANRVDVDFFDLTGHLDGTPHGSPIASRSFTLVAPPDSSPLPAEVAICLSYHSAFGTDLEESGSMRPKARDRGRIYLGPLNILTLSEDSAGHEAFVTPNCRQTIAEAAAGFGADLDLATWCVWSRADAALKPVVAGYVDNAFDVQRRRGVKSTARFNFSIV